MVGLLAASSIFAGINFSGEFSGGYAANISFDDASGSSIAPTSSSLEGKLNIKASDDDGIWSIELKNQFTIGSASADAKATINFDKLAALLGSDWGSWKFSMVAGNNKKPSLASAYSDKVGGLYSASNANALFPMVFTVSDGNWVDLQVGVDPTFGKINFDADGKYTKDATTDKVASFLASAKSTPIDGLNLSLGYIFNVNGGAAHAIEFDFALDLAKMIGVDFDLALSGGDTFKFGNIAGAAIKNTGSLNNTADVGVYAGIDLINGFAEVSIIGTDASALVISGIAGINSNCGIEGLNVSASVGSIDLKDFIHNVAIETKASYDFDFGLSSVFDATIGILGKDFVTYTIAETVKYNFGGFGGMTAECTVQLSGLQENVNLTITPKLGIKF